MLDGTICANCGHPETEHKPGKGKRPLLLCPVNKKAKP
jgi:hypothetical protein